jgi:hypothetical protein
MGTRGINGFVVKGKHYGQYNQFDTYPSGMGKDMVKLARLITKNEGWNKFRKNAEKVQDIGETTNDTALIEKYSSYTDLQVSNQVETDTYCLLRHLQGVKLLEEIYKGRCLHIRDNMEFVKDSLFCEYAYFFNLDSMVIEFWKGFQKEPQMWNPFGTSPNSDGYYPIKLVGVFQLSRIPRNWADVFGVYDEEENELDVEVPGNQAKLYLLCEHLKTLASPAVEGCVIRTPEGWNLNQ